MKNLIIHFLISPISRFVKRALHSPFGFQILSLGFFMIFVLGFQPAYFAGTPEPFGTVVFGETGTIYPISEPGFIDNSVGTGSTGLRETFVKDEQGNVIVKVEAKKRTQSISYSVKSGDTITGVASKFGIKVATLLWANKLTSKESLAVGRSLKIPPTDGVFYTVARGDTLVDIAKMYNVDAQKIKTYNSLKGDGTVISGQEIFIPDAKRIFTQNAGAAPNVSGNASVSTGSSIASIGFSLRRPTQGVITQGFHNGHFAIDIANRLNTPIYAAAGGTVITSDDGWNYGYGSYIIIDNGNGIQTLYAHNNERKVEVGDTVKTGQLIALMGNTGNVWGPTGIHLHFEVHINGRKVNPMNYFGD